MSAWFLVVCGISHDMEEFERHHRRCTWKSTAAN
jgi:hypothetical protein